jgi:hypothetical protein
MSDLKDIEDGVNRLFTEHGEEVFENAQSAAAGEAGTDVIDGIVHRWDGRLLMSFESDETGAARTTWES